MKKNSSKKTTQPTSMSLMRIHQELSGEQKTLFNESIGDAREIFLFPLEDGVLLYAPLKGISEVISFAVADLLRKQIDGDYSNMDDESPISELRGRGLFTPSKIDRQDFDNPSNKWKPRHVTFSTTQKCTLRCTYCYAEGGRLDDKNIPRELVKAAIDLIMKNAAELQLCPSIDFIGEGEATANWKEFRWGIEYFCGKSKELGFSPEIGLVTNGVFPISRIPYIASVCTRVVISLDGLAAINDTYRVMPNGKGSFRHVLRTMNMFDRVDKKYHIKSAISQSALFELPSFIEFIGEKTKCRSVFLEPMFDVSAITSLKPNVQSIYANDFVNAYRLALAVAEKYGIDLGYPGADTDTTYSFCSATSAKGFLVTSKGLVTSCPEVLQATDPRAELFQYGSWNAESKEFEVNNARIDKLGKLNALDIKKCQGCIAKFNCAGDCYARTAVSNGDPWALGYTHRCHITRQILVDALLKGGFKSEVPHLQTS